MHTDVSQGLCPSQEPAQNVDLIIFRMHDGDTHLSHITHIAWGLLRLIHLSDVRRLTDNVYLQLR